MKLKWSRVQFSVDQNFGLKPALWGKLLNYLNWRVFNYNQGRLYFKECCINMICWLHITSQKNKRAAAVQLVERWMSNWIGWSWEQNPAAIHPDWGFQRGFIGHIREMARWFLETRTLATAFKYSPPIIFRPFSYHCLISKVLRSSNLRLTDLRN